MSEMEIDINRASNLIDPSLRIWGWEIPVYLFLGGLTAGLMIVGALLALRIPLAERSRWSRWLPFAAPLFISVGMLALLLDLGNRLHVYRFYLTFRWGSPMSWGSWILLAVYPAALLLGLVGLTDAEAARLGAWRPLRVLRLDRLLERAWQLARRREAAVLRVNIALGAALGVYTGILLGTLAARPAWSSTLLGPLFLVSGFSAGAALVMLFPLRSGEHRLLHRWDLWAIGLELALLLLFLLGLATGGAESQRAAELFLGGRFTAPFFALVVAAGLAVPFALALAERRLQLRPTLLGPSLLLAGGLSLRWILVLAGQVY